MAPLAPVTARTQSILGVFTAELAESAEKPRAKVVSLAALITAPVILFNCFVISAVNGYTIFNIKR